MIKKELNYFPLGDSYTIGEAVDENQRWPNLLVKHLIMDGIQINLTGNPAFTGCTSADLIENQLPLFRNIKPDFSSLLIGVNDWVQEVPTDRYRDNLRHILMEMLKVLGRPEKLFVVSIPDFGKTPEGPKYAKGRNINSGLIEFNMLIRKEAENLNIAFIDIFDISLQSQSWPELTANDGLHPSALQYELWEKRIYSIAYKLIMIIL
jgi:acyl-CoA thioesterase I